MRKTIATIWLIGMATGASGEVLGNFELSFQGGNFHGNAVNESGEDATEAAYFGLLGLGGTVYSDIAGAWVLQGHGQVVSNVGKDSRAGFDDDPGRDDNYMSYVLLEGHAVNQSSDITWGVFGGLWLGEVDDLEEEAVSELDIDKAQKYYFGAEAIFENGPIDAYVQLGLTDTIGNDFSDTTSEGTDYRQIRDGAFVSIGGSYHQSDALSLNGRIATVFGESSDVNDEIDPEDFRGVYAEIGFEYQISGQPMTISGGLGHNYSEFPDDEGIDEEAPAATNSTYAFLGVSYWFGGPVVSNQRREMLPVRAADFLVAAESAAIGNLN
jgi:hypothetical protein